MKIIVILALVLGYNNLCFSQEWKLISTTKNGDKYFIKKYDNRKTPKFWYKHTSENLSYKKNGQTFYANGYSIILWGIDCLNRKMKFLEMISYDSNDILLEHWKNEEATWGEVIPETIGESALLKACEMFQ